MDLKALNREELQQFNQLKRTHYADEKTYELCLTYYLEYKSGCDTHTLQHEKIPIALKCAFFMAEKSQVILNMVGDRVKGVSLSLGQLLREHKLDDIMIMLRDFSKKVVIADKEASQDLLNIIREISFLITFHKKFEKVINKLELRERVPESGYLKIFSSFVWLIYVHAKNIVLKKNLELIENTCMLAHSVAFMLIYSWDYLSSGLLMKGERKLHEKSSMKDISLLVKERILEEFLIRNTEIYLSISSELERFFQELVEKGVIKNTHDKTDFLSPDLINHNYKRLDNLYEKHLGGEDLDERIFFKDRAANLTPSKFTPFARQGYANKAVAKPSKLGGNFGHFGEITTNKDTFSSHRILNYDMLDRQETNHKPLLSNFGEMKLPKTVVQSPSMIKIPLICSTPVTTGMEMFNYITEKSRKVKDMQTNRSQCHDSMAIRLIDELYDKAKKDVDKKIKEPRVNLIFSLYKLAAEDYLALHQSQRDNSGVMKAILAVSLQLVLFVENSQFKFQDIEAQLHLEVFELWKACDFYLKFDKVMPSPLKLHLLDLEVALISSKIWKDKSMISLLQNYVRDERSSNDPRYEFVERLFKRVLHQAAFQINQLCIGLQLQDHMLQSIYDILKHIFSQKIGLMTYRHIDQMIMCATYAICKREQQTIKFGDIIETYKERNSHIESQLKGIIYDIVTPEAEAPKNLITLYNEQFLVPMREVVVAVANRNTDSHNNSSHSISQYSSNGIRSRVANPNVTNILQSPLKEIIPNEVNNRMRNKKTPGHNGKFNNISQAHLLYAYNESPMLRHDPVSIKIPVHSKKIINYEEEEEKLKKKNIQLDYQDLDKLSPRTLPNQFNRKFMNANWKQSKGNDCTPGRVKATPGYTQPSPYEQSQLGGKGIGLPKPISSFAVNINVNKPQKYDYKRH